MSVKTKVCLRMSRANDVNLYLGDHVLVGETDDQTVLGCVVLILVLNDQTLASVVVSLSLAAATVLDLVALEVNAVLDNFKETHGDCVGLGATNSYECGYRSLSYASVY